MLRERRFHSGTIGLNYAAGPPNGPPFVLLHGGSARWQYGTTFLAALVNHWHVYAPDLRGHGASDRAPGAYRLSDYVADIAAFLTQVVRAPAVLYGHSLGGEIAIMAAAMHPELVRAVIHGDVPFSRENHPTEQPAHKAMNALWHGLAGRPIAEIAVALKEMPFSLPGQDQPRRAAEVFGEESPWFDFQATNLHLLDPGVLAAVLAGPDTMLDGYEPEQVLPAITCPVLILQADPAAGGLLSDAEVAKGLRLLRHATHLRLEGIGHELHGPPGQAPQVLRAISPFLDELRSADNRP